MQPSWLYLKKNKSKYKKNLLISNKTSLLFDKKFFLNNLDSFNRFNIVLAKMKQRNWCDCFKKYMCNVQLKNIRLEWQ